MARRKKFRIPGVSFSWKRALGITKAKRKFAKATGIPTTKSGRQRKIGRAITGGGCLLQILRAFMFTMLIALMIGLCLGLSSCGGGNDSSPNSEPQATAGISATPEPKQEVTPIPTPTPTPEPTPEPEPLDLSGEWKQINSNSDTSYHIATINGGTIEIYWIFEEDDMQALYWAGTYEAPEKDAESYSWDSVNDKEKTGAAMLASGADTKTITYANGQISYSASAMGVNQTVKLEKQ